MNFTFFFKQSMLSPVRVSYTHFLLFKSFLWILWHQRKHCWHISRQSCKGKFGCRFPKRRKNKKTNLVQIRSNICIPRLSSWIHLDYCAFWNAIAAFHYRSFFQHSLIILWIPDQNELFNPHWDKGHRILAKIDLTKTQLQNPTTLYDKIVGILLEIFQTSRSDWRIPDFFLSEYKYVPWNNCHLSTRNITVWS